MYMLEDGYYISVYSNIDPIMNCYKNCFIRHDHNISLWKKSGSDIKLVHHWELERQTGLKHHQVSFFNQEDFKNYVEGLLSQYDIGLKDIKQIIGTPGADTNMKYYNNDFGDDLTYHAAAHLFSSIMMDSKIFYNNKILALSFDGGSDVTIDKDITTKCNFMGSYSENGNIKYFPISSPGLYWIVSAIIFKSEEGTLMALATASESRTLEKLIDSKDIIDAYNYNDIFSIREQIEHLKETVFNYNKDDQGIKFNYFDSRFTEEENKISIIMKIIQEISVINVDKNIDKAINDFGIDPQNTYISLSGGYALNCPTNTHIMHKYKFKGQLIPPAVNDGGQALGIGLYFFFKKEKEFNFKLENAYYGDADYTMNSILENKDIDSFIENVEYNLDKFVDDIIVAPVVWVSGRAEIGPRALGNRSILADPRSNISKDLLNLYKKRQWWRPVAPIILEECIDDWFDDGFESPYMLNNFIVKEEKRHIVPPIMHLDNTARIQTVNENNNSQLYKVLRKFYEKSKVPILCNTSLNDKGEPIINNFMQALNFAMRKGIKIIYFNGVRVLLRNHSKFPSIDPEPRNNEFFTKYSEKDIQKYNPFGLTIQEYLLCMGNQSLQKYDITNREDIEQLRRITFQLAQKFNINDMFFSPKHLVVPSHTSI